MDDEKIELSRRLHEAEQTLEAIRSGQVDALIVNDSKGQQVYSLINPDHPYQVFFENMNEAAIILSKEQLILYGNNSFFEFIESSNEQMIGTSILDIIPEEHHLFFTRSIQSGKKIKTELVILTKNRKIRTVLISMFEGVWNEAEQVCLLMRDITELKRAQQYVKTSESISKILSESSHIKDVSQSIIELLSENLRWEVMITWLWNKEKKKFQCIDISHIEGLDIEAFKNKTNTLDMKSALLFGQASTTNRPVWKKDVTEDCSFIRRNEAIENNLRGALSFSFNQNSEFAGFTELFSREVFTDDIDNLMLELISSIGISIGLFIQRSSFERIKFQFSKALDLSVNSIYSVDINGFIKSWFPGAEKVYGWKAEEMVGNSINRLYPSNNTDEFDPFSKKVVSGNAIESHESQRVGKEGNRIWVNSSYDGIRDLFGMITEIIVVEQDITTQKNFETLLIESNRRFDSFIEIAEEWVWELDKIGTFVFSNLAIWPIIGYQPEEILGKNLLYFVSEEDRNKTETELIDYAIKKKGWKHLTIPLIHKNGSYHWIETNANVLLGPDNELLGFRGSGRDITESKNLDKVKNEFISIMSHELRTPLTVIYGALTLLISKELDLQVRKDLLNTAQRNCARLTSLINDTMDFEKLQLGKLKFDFKKINISDVIIDSIQSSEMIAQKINVNLVIEGSLPVVEVNGDYSRLVQLITNLLSNAIKFSPNDGTVKVSLEVMGDKARISVSDKGLGIPKEFHSKIFLSFSQAEASIQHKTGGTGLGLYISKSIIEAHGGTINYKTNIGQGTTFFFDIPLATKDKK